MIEDIEIFDNGIIADSEDIITLIGIIKTENGVRSSLINI